MTDHDYEAALKDMPFLERAKDFEEYKADLALWIEENRDAIIHALRFTQKMMGEPSKGMLTELMNEWDSTGKRTILDNFKTMRNQALKELEEEK